MERDKSPNGENCNAEWGGCNCGECLELESNKDAWQEASAAGDPDNEENR
jgi:hypothetical protein